MIVKESSFPYDIDAPESDKKTFSDDSPVKKSFHRDQGFYHGGTTMEGRQVHAYIYRSASRSSTEAVIKVYGESHLINEINKSLPLICNFLNGQYSASGSCLIQSPLAQLAAYGVSEDSGKRNTYNVPSARGHLKIAFTDYFDPESDKPKDFKKTDLHDFAVYLAMLIADEKCLDIMRINTRDKTAQNATVKSLGSVTRR